MPDYRRAFKPGGLFFLTTVTNFQRPILTTASARRILRDAIEQTRLERPFSIEAVVLLPDHFHWIITLPERDSDYPTRMRLLKARFTHNYLTAGGRDAGRSTSRCSQRERSIWHRRYWEHTVRDATDFERISNYIHYNPVKHGHAACPHAWPFSSFARFVEGKRYPASWQCTCDGHKPPPPDFGDVGPLAGE